MGTENGRRRRATTRELVVTQLVNKFAAADLRAIKQLTDIVQSAERHRDACAAQPEPAQLTAPDKGVIELFVARLRRQIAAEAAEAADASAGDQPDCNESAASCALAPRAMTRTKF
jgi:hypothetical protein